MTEDEALEFDRLVRATARRVCNNFPDVDAEDIAQSLWEYLFSTGAEFSPDQQGIKSLLWKKGKALAWDVRKENLRSCAQYSYLVSDVRKILETCFEDQRDWMTAYVPKDAKENERDNMAGLEVRLDVLIAFRKMHSDYQGAILRRFQDQLVPEPRSADSKRLERAIKRLTDYMNNYYSSGSGHPGARHPVSNATAAYLIQNQER